jgi:serine kinase of HPr protein (carbohydrate metabolism regulator)
MIRVHGTCIEIAGSGVLLRGPSGCGKSDLALRLIDGGAHLVADDQTELRRLGSEIVASAPPQIAVRLEIRGVGIVSCAAVSAVPLRLVVDLVQAEQVERLPETQTCRYLDRELALLALAPFEASAPAKLRFALHAVVATRSLMEHAS